MTISKWQGCIKGSFAKTSVDTIWYKNKVSFKINILGETYRQRSSRGRRGAPSSCYPIAKQPWVTHSQPCRGKCTKEATLCLCHLHSRRGIERSQERPRCLWYSKNSRADEVAFLERTTFLSSAFRIAYPALGSSLRHQSQLPSKLLKERPEWASRSLWICTFSGFQQIFSVF